MKKLICTSFFQLENDIIKYWLKSAAMFFIELRNKESFF